MKETSFEPLAYISNLALTEDPSVVQEYDGAWLFRVSDGHFVMAHCVAEHGHKGEARLRTVFPETWAPFFQERNPLIDFQYDHWGPSDELPDLAGN